MTTGSRGRGPRGSERGFALVGVLLALALLSLLAAAGFLLASTEVLVARGHRASLDAALAAEAGLAELLATTVGPPPPETPAGLPGRPATVTALELVGTSDGRSVYLLRSRTEASEGAVREVERLAAAVPPTGPLPAALTSAGPVTGGGSGALVSGLDRAGPDACGAAPGDVAGLAVRPGGADSVVAATLEGSPPVLESDEPTAAAVPDGAALVAELEALASATEAVRAVPAGTTLGPGSSGEGLLVAPGELVLEDGFRWEGLVVAGGDLSLRGRPRVRGGVLAGLAGGSGGGPSPPVADLGADSAEVVYDRCAVAAALRASSRLVSLRGGWSEVYR